MKKSIKITSLTTAALATFILVNSNVSSNVKAASQESNIATQAKSAKDNAQANVDSAKASVETAQKDVDSANSELKEAQAQRKKADTDYRNQAEQVKKDRDSLKQNQKALDQAKNNRKNAQDSLDKASHNQETANSNKSLAEKVLDQVNQDVDNQINIVDKAISNANNKQQTTDNKQKKALEAKQKADSAQEAANQANQKLIEATKAAEKASSDINRQNKNVDQDQVALDQATNEEEVANKDVNERQIAFDKATTDSQKADESLKKAQSELNRKIEAYNDQTAKAANLKKEADDSKAVADKDKATRDALKPLYDEANDTARYQAAKEAVTKQQSVLNDAQNAKEAADKAVSDKNTEIDKYNKNKSKAESNLQSKRDAKNAEDSDVNAKNAAFEAAERKNRAAKDRLDYANASVDQDSKKLDQANNNKKETTDKFISAKIAKEAALSAKNSADGAQQAAQEAANQAKATLEQAKNNAKSDQDKQKDLQNQLNNLKELTKNTINIPDIAKLKQAFIDYQKTGQLNNDDIAYVNNARKQNEFVSSDADKKEKIDLNNLSEDQIQEMSLFYSDLINKLRSQLGWSSVHVTKGSISFAKALSKQYKDDQKSGKYNFDPDNNNGSYWHDAKGINDLSDKWGLESNQDDPKTKDTDERAIEQRYEDATDPGVNGTETMDDWKKQIYDTVNSMIFPDGNGFDEPGKPAKYEMGHTAGILGADSNYQEDLVPDGKTELENAEKYFKLEKKAAINFANDFNWEGMTVTDKGLTFHSKEEYIRIKTNQAEKELKEETQRINTNIKNGQYVAAIIDKPNPKSDRSMIHFINIDSGDVKDPIKFDKTEILSYQDQINKIQKSLNDINEDLKLLQQNIDKAQKDNDEKNADLEKAIIEAKKKANSYDKAVQATEDTQADLDKITKSIKSLQTKLDNDKEIQRNAQSNFDSASATYNDAQAALNTAKNNQNKAQTEYEAAKTAVDSATTNLQNAQSDLANLKEDAQIKTITAAKAQEKLDALKAHVNDLDQVNVKYNNADSVYKKSQATFETSQNAAIDAQKEADKLEQVKESAQNMVDNYQNIADRAKTLLSTANTRLQMAKANLQTAKLVKSQASQTLRSAEDKLLQLKDIESKASANKVSATNEKQRTEQNAELEQQIFEELNNEFLQVKKASDYANQVAQNAQNKLQQLKNIQVQKANEKQKADLASINAQKVVNNVKQLVEEAQNQVNQVQKNLETAQEKAATSRSRLNDLAKVKEFAENRTSQAQSKVDEANAKLQTAKSNLTAAQKALDNIIASENASQQSQHVAPAETGNNQNVVATIDTTPIVVQTNIDKDNNIVSANATPEIQTTLEDTVLQIVSVPENNAGVPVYSIPNGTKVIKTLSLGDKANSTAYTTIANTKWYQIGENEWIKSDEHVKILDNSQTEVQNKSVKTPSAKKVKVTHTAFVYNGKGKLVRKGLKANKIKRGGSVKILGTEIIHGKKYYRIGKNQYIKAINTRISVKGKVKGKKNHKVAVYNKNGRKIKIYVKAGHSYKLNEKRVIKGKTYYKISRKNLWIPASKIR